MSQTLSLAVSAKLRGFMIATIALAFASHLAAPASAQSGTRTAPPRSSVPSGSGTKNAAGVTSPGKDVGLHGYCPVCVVKMGKWIRGTSQFSAKQDGKTYLFPSEEQKQMFLQNPAQYTPVLGGDCVVALVEMNKRVPGSVQYAALQDGRLFLFSNEKAKGMFEANQAKYANADLALGGKCSVCRVEMNQDVDGTPQFTSIYKGLRYQFPGEDQLKMFNQNPAKYGVQK